MNARAWTNKRALDSAQDAYDNQTPDEQCGCYLDEFCAICDPHRYEESVADWIWSNREDDPCNLS